jgi:hypothetical protein
MGVAHGVMPLPEFLSRGSRVSRLTLCSLHLLLLNLRSPAFISGYKIFFAPLHLCVFALSAPFMTVSQAALHKEVRPVSVCPEQRPVIKSISSATRSH